MTDVMSHVMSRVARCRDAGRELLGIGTGTRPLNSFAAGIAESGAGWYALVALSIFTALDEATAYVISAVGPDISNALGLSPSTYAMLAAQRQAFVGLTALQFASMFYRRRRRALLATQFGIQYGLSLVVGSFVTWAPGMTFAIGGSGTGSAVVYAAHRPLLMDRYPPGVRLRALSFHRGAAVLGAIAGPMLVTALAAGAGLSWRSTLLAIGVIFLLVSLLGVRLRDPGYGRFDSDRIAALMHADSAGTPPALDDPSELGFTEAVRRVWLIPTMRRLLAVWAVLGVAVNPLVTYQGFWLKEQFGLATSQRAIFLAGSWVLALPVLWFVSRTGERAWREDPVRLVRITGRVLVALAVGLLVAVVPVLGVSLLGFAVVFAAEAVAVATLSMILMTVVRPRSRPIVAALSAVYFGLIGGEGGSILLSGVASRYSVSVAIIVLVVPALGAALLMGRTVSRLETDLNGVVTEVLEDEGVRTLVARSGPSIPLLSCRGIDFGYGRLQVLHGVDFTVRDGEMLALLGTNGAGKSSLLKVISGIGLPTAGTVRFKGSDITYVDAQRRVPMGITQIPGGRAVFGALTVIDNLRGMGYTLGRDKRRLDAAIDECFEMFPVLAERRHAAAATLSGGEQQMLALSKAFILRPRLLLIDELSLGLAPIVVDRLLGVVRRINDTGTAVVLVEQSVSIALTVVDHAYFMEKGTVRFDGPADELMARDDLLRAVFLGADARNGSSA